MPRRSEGGEVAPAASARGCSRGGRFTGSRALADPTRLSLAASLREGGELCACDLAWISGRPRNLVSHHLRALKREGLAASRRDGKIVFYSLTEVGADLLDRVLGAMAVSQSVIAAAR